MKTREASKCREWEKERRNKLNQSFQDLSKLLPDHDPPVMLSKIDILQKASSYINELKIKLKKVLTEEGIKKVECEEIEQLNEWIKKLLLRNEQLSTLLKNAGIKIPSEIGVLKGFKDLLRWSNKVTPDEAKNLADRELQKENRTETPKVKKKLKSKQSKKFTSRKKHSKTLKGLIKSNKNDVKIISNIAVTQNRGNSALQTCFIVGNKSSINFPKNGNIKTAGTAITNTTSLAASKMAAIVAPPISAPKINPPLNTLGPGTIILSNGSVLPILPQPVLPSRILTNPILLKPPPTNTYIVMSTTLNNILDVNTTSHSSPRNSVTEKCFPRIRPKVNITKVTQVNKVPIPALTSNYTDFRTLNDEPCNDNTKSPKDLKTHLNKKRKLDKIDLINKRLKNEEVAMVTDQLTKTIKENPQTMQTNINEVLTKNTESGKSPIKSLQESTPSRNTQVSKENLEVITKCINFKTTHTNQLDLNTDKQNQNNTVTEVVNVASQFNLESVVNENSVNAKKSIVNNKEKDLHQSINKSEYCSLNNSSTIAIATLPDKKTEVTSPTTKTVVTIHESNSIATQNNSLTKISSLSRTDNISSVNISTVSLKENTIIKDYSEDSSINKSVLLEENISESERILTTDVTCKKDRNLEENSATNLVTLAQADTEISDKNLELGMNLNHSELSNDIFSSLQVPIGSQNPESTSPTAAFLLAFPLVSSLTGVKVTEVIEEENTDSRHETPTLLQIGTMDSTKTTQSISESLTPNLLNLDNFSFFSGKEMCNNLYSFENTNMYSAVSQNTTNSDHKIINKELKPKIHDSPKIVKEVIDVTTTTVTSVASSIYDSVAQSRQSVQHNYLKGNASTTQSKLLTSSYIHSNSVMNLPYESRQKSTINNESANKELSANYCTASKNADVVTCNTITSNNQKPEAMSNNSNSFNTTVVVTSINQCNTYNPFSDFSKSNSVHCYPTLSKPYTEPLYTNSNHYSCPQNNSNNFNQNVYYASKPVQSKFSSSYGGPTYQESSYSVEYKNKRDQTNRSNMNFYSQNKFKDKLSHLKSRPVNQPKPPINWMTTPDFRPQHNTDYLVPPPFARDIEYNNSLYSSSSFASSTHTSYLNASSTIYQTPEFQNDNRKPDNNLTIISSANSIQRNDFEENQFSWSPTKLPQFLDTSHSFVSSTLPTLVGDLALGTNQQHIDHKEREHASKKDSRRSKVSSNGFDNQNNFLSVSQLVENKDLNVTRAVNRRSNGNKNNKGSINKNNKHPRKSNEQKEIEMSYDPKVDVNVDKNIKQNQSMYSSQPNSNWITDCNKNRHAHKNSQSNYSAEALIGHQDQSDHKNKLRQQQTNYSVNKALPIPTFLSDNIVPYFPPVEIPQENSFIQTTNYQSNTLTFSSQNNIYSSGTYISSGATITSNYLQNSGLIPEFNTHDYNMPASDNAPVLDKIENKLSNRNEIKQSLNRTHTDDRISLQQTPNECAGNPSSFMKKTKGKHSSESLHTMVDFGFLSMPNTINSPILPDDFHSHSNFLPPPTPGQLYSCKNPLYTTKQSDLNTSLLPLPPVPTVSRNTSQHFENSSSNISSSLTSFNLSAIFPEINKGPLPTLYPSELSKSKNYNFQRNCLGNSVQDTYNKSAATSYTN